MLLDKLNFFLNVFTLFSKTSIEINTLESVHVLFRHGERTIDPVTTYPNDPYKTKSYYPIGWGELTTQGKRTIYEKVGIALRKRYDKFLGKIYSPDILEARSSHYSRAKTSLLLALAGLFPPSFSQMWNTELHWQPIPISYLPAETDNEFFGFFSEEAIKLRKAYISTPEYKKMLSKHDEIIDYVTKHSGINVTEMYDLSKLYLALLAEDEFKLKLPEWTQAVYPMPLKMLTMEMFYDQTATIELIQYASGYMLQRILNNVNDHVMGYRRTKLYLLSGHEFNCAHILILLGVFEPHSPPYGAQVIFELHKINNIYGFKIYYQDFTKGDPQLLKLPNCSTFCPLDQFNANYQKFLPNK